MFCIFKNSFRNVKDNKKNIIMSLFVSIAIISAVLVLTSIAIAPHSLTDFFVPSRVELKDSAEKVVYAQNSRLNSMAIPDTLPGGQYSLYVNGEFQDTLNIQGSAKAEETIRTTSNPKPEIRNINGIQAVTWSQAETSDRLSNSAYLDNIKTGLFKWLDQQKVMMAEVNTSVLAGTFLLAFLLLTFNLSALMSSLRKGSNSIITFFGNGVEELPLTLAISLVRLISFIVVYLLLSITFSALDFQQQSSVLVGVACIGLGIFVMGVFQSVLSSQNIYAEILVVVVFGLLGFLLSEYPILLAGILLLLVHLVIPVVIPKDRPEEKEEKSDAWKESLLP